MMDRGALKLFRKGLPDLDRLFLRYGPTTRLPELSTDFGNSSGQYEPSSKGVTNVWTDHTSKELWTSQESISGLDGVGQDGLTSWSVFSWERLWFQDS